MLSRGCVLLSLQCSESRCVLYINTKKTQPRRQRTTNMAVANSLQMLKTVTMDFSVIRSKPHFSQRLSRLFFSAGSRLSRIFCHRLAGLTQITTGGRLSWGLWGLVDNALLLFQGFGLTLLLPRRYTATFGGL